MVRTATRRAAHLKDVRALERLEGSELQPCWYGRPSGSPGGAVSVSEYPAGPEPARQERDIPSTGRSYDENIKPYIQFFLLFLKCKIFKGNFYIGKTNSKRRELIHRLNKQTLKPHFYEVNGHSVIATAATADALMAPPPCVLIYAHNVPLEMFYSRKNRAATSLHFEMTGRIVK